MAVTITHAHVAVGPNNGNGEVALEEWNEAHTVTGLGTAAEADTTDFATAAQGAKADTAVQPADITNMLETSDIGSTVQAYDADLTTIGGLSKTDGNFIVANGTAWVVESGSTARTSLGLGTGDSPQFTAVNIGNASDTTLTRASAGVLAVGGNNILTVAGGTMTGELIMADQLLTRALLKDFGLEVQAHSNTGSTETFDMTNGNVHTATLDQNSTFTFSNPTATGDMCVWYLYLTNGGAFTVTWPASVDWDAATTPELQASGTDLLAFITFDAGTNWLGFHVWSSA